MKQTFTLDDLIKYAYHETGLFESVRIQQAIDENPELCEEYIQLMDTLYKMDTLLVDPSDAMVQRILEYSKTTTPHPVH